MAEFNTEDKYANLNMNGFNITLVGSITDSDGNALGGVTTLGGLSGVTITSPSNGEVLKYNGSAWVNAAESGGISALNDISDVTAPSPSSGQYLKWNGSAWVNATVPTGGSDYPIADYVIELSGSTATGTRTSDDTVVSSGTTHDVVFQAVIDDAESTGNLWVHVKKGNYTFTATVDVNSHLRFTGDGQEATELKKGNSLTDPLLTINGDLTASTHYRVTFLDIKFDGNKANTTGDIIIAYGIIQSHFHRCHWENAYDNCLELRPASGGDNFDFGHHNQIFDCLFDQSNGAGTGVGVYMRNNDENTILACQFQYCNIGIYDDTGFNQIIGNSFVNEGKGVYLINCSRTHVQNNIFDLLDDHAVHLKGAFNSVTGNRFYGIGQGATANTKKMIWIEYFGTNIVTDNMLLNTGTGRAHSGIHENGNAAEDTYGNNIIANNMFVKMHGSNSTDLDSGNTWGTGYLVQDNTNATSNNVDA